MTYVARRKNIRVFEFKQICLVFLTFSFNNVYRFQKEMFDEDMKMCHVDLVDTAKAYKSMKPKAFYNDLHISPLMVMLLLSLS